MNNTQRDIPEAHSSAVNQEIMIIKAYDVFKEKGIDVEYLIGYEGNAFAYTGDIEKDILSIASVHPIREEGMKELLKKSESNWGVVEKLIHDNKLVETGYKNKRFYMRKIVGKVYEIATGEFLPNKFGIDPKLFDYIQIRDIEKLLVGNPIDAIFESLTKIWDTNTSKNYYYTKGEKLSSKFEQQMYKIFPEVYDVIIHNSARNSKIQDVLNKDRFCLIIMDGMSLRESNFIINDLKRFGEVEYSYAYSAIPSETEFFTRKNFGALSPSHIKTNGKYVFFHMKRVNEIEDMVNELQKEQRRFYERW